MCQICFYYNENNRVKGNVIINNLKICKNIDVIPPFIKNFNILKCSIINNNKLKKIENLPTTIKELIIHNSLSIEKISSNMPNLTILKI